jgi:hypothetical protein
MVIDETLLTLSSIKRSCEIGFIKPLKVLKKAWDTPGIAGVLVWSLASAYSCPNFIVS